MSKAGLGNVRRCLLVSALVVLALAGYVCPAGAAENTFPASGSVGIGTTTPAAKLQVGTNAVSGVVNQGSAAQSILLEKGFTVYNANQTAYPYEAQLSIDASSLSLWGNLYYSGGFKLFDTNRAPVGIRLRSDNASSAIEFSTSAENVAGLPTQMVLNRNGNLGIGTMTPSAKLHVIGDAVVTGNIAAKYQDVAEWVPTRAGALAAGTVVIIDPQARNQVLPAAQPYDSRVAGVVSAKPGVLLGEAGDDKVKVAHAGRVPVKVDASFGPIQVGDLLVTSPTSGHAMRSTPVDLGGIPIHRPGTVVGKALEPLTEGQGEILVLLTLQ